MPQVITSTQVLPDSLGITKTEAIAALPYLEMLKRGELGRFTFTDSGGQVLTLELGGGDKDLNHLLNETVAGNALAVSLTLKLAHHNFIRLVNAFRHWGDGATEVLLQVNGPNGHLCSFRFFYTGA